MTPYAYAQELAENLLTGIGLPEPVLAQLGDVIVDCSRTWVTVGNTNSQNVVDGAPHCGTAEIGDIQFVTAFECGFISEEDGLTDPDKLDELSQQQDHYGQVLREIAEQLVNQSIVGGQFNGVQYQNNGALGMVVVSFSAAIP